MSSRPFIFFFILLFTHHLGPVNAAENSTGREDSQPTQYEVLYEQLMNLEVDFNFAADVSNLTIQRDVGNFVLQEGKLYLCKPVMNQTCAAIFSGKGRFLFTPPTEIEKAQLYRFYKKESLDEEFNLLFIIFADNTLQELSKKLNFKKEPATSNLRKQLQDCLNYMGDKKAKEFNPAIIKTLLDRQSNQLFYAHFSRKKSKPMFFEINPFEVEEIRFMRRPKRDKEHSKEVISQFHSQEDYDQNVDLSYETKDRLNITNYKINSIIDKNFNFFSSAEITCTSMKDRQNWIDLFLFRDLKVDSVFWGNGQKVNFFKRKENPYLWIKTGAPLAKGQEYKIKIYYHGELFDVWEDWVSIKSPSFWYPQILGRMNKAKFDLTFHTPADFDFISVGKKVSSKTQKKMTTSRWITEKPVRQASFNIGKFNEHTLNNPKIPPVTVSISKVYPRWVEGRFVILKNSERSVAGDIGASLEFFQQVFGQSPVSEFNATEIPWSHGQAFPGLIHLSWGTYQSLNSQGYNEIFRAHEVAHQWWGIGVGFRTYHDQWISEGFSEYAGLWYMQMVLQDNKKFFDILKEWKKQIINNRKDIFGSGQEAGPIWLGYRTSSSTTRGDYSLIIYKKGAWVIHMLRNMLIDLKTMNEDRFMSLMKDFYTTYHEKQASTEDFQRIVEKHIGSEMGWFFKQWVYGTDIPTYKFAYKSEKTPEGKYKVTCKIEQL